MNHRPEVWLRGPIAGVRPDVMPIVHALLQVREEIEAAVLSMSADELSSTPGGAASVAFHLRHIAGSLDRLLTYARGEALTDAQQSALAAEGATLSGITASMLVASVQRAIDRAIEQVKGTALESLDAPRAVGRAALPSTVRGLLYHAAEHAQRHAGQIVTTAKVVRGSRSGGERP
jgi:uncharacterized damage-inducible protein DinB